MYVCLAGVRIVEGGCSWGTQGTLGWGLGAGRGALTDYSDSPSHQHVQLGPSVAKLVLNQYLGAVLRQFSGRWRWRGIECVCVWW